MNLVLMGLPAETRALVDALKNAPGVSVVAVSSPYRTRDEPEWVHVYLTADVYPDLKTEDMR
jgi:hypothetical protein